MLCTALYFKSYGGASFVTSGSLSQLTHLARRGMCLISSASHGSFPIFSLTFDAYYSQVTWKWPSHFSKLLTICFRIFCFEETNATLLLVLIERKITSSVHTENWFFFNRIHTARWCLQGYDYCLYEHHPVEVLQLISCMANDVVLKRWCWTF